MTKVAINKEIQWWSCATWGLVPGYPCRGVASLGCRPIDPPAHEPECRPEACDNLCVRTRAVL